MKLNFNHKERRLRSVLRWGVCLLCVCTAIPGGMRAQTPIKLGSALDSANNNLEIRNEKLKVEYQALLSKTGANLPQTMLFSENGQINSRYVDYRFGVSQTINFPTVYAKRKNVFNQEYTTGLIGLQVKELELKKQVLITYYHLAYLQKKEDILLKNDTVYANFLEKSRLRFKAGQSNVLENTTAEIERNRITMQLRELQQDKAIYLLQLQWLLNTRSQYMPAPDSFRLVLPPIDSAMVSRHPQLRMLLQEKQAVVAQTELERNKLLPDLSLSYANMSMYGVGADNVFYDRNTRFQSVQLSVGIPVFAGAQKAAVQASRSQERIADNNYLVALGTLNNHWQQTIALYNKYQETLKYYETIGLKNADLMISTVNKQFASGEINYLNWVTLTNQALGAKTEYLDAVNNNNETVIELMYLMGQ